jgi:hypothetical protein
MQRPPAMEVASQAPATSHELEEPLGFLAKYDPDVTVERVEKEVIKTQTEIASIMEEAPVYRTPQHFMPERLSQSLRSLESPRPPMR